MSETDPRQPNVILIVADDHGYGDLSCMGSETVKTPNLDRLAESGALLTEFYSNSPVCSPARAALLSGRYPGNAGVRSILQGYRTTPGLPPSVPTLAEALGELGYRTELVGKWHLGLTPPSRPEAHGFEHSFGNLAGAVDYFSHIHYSPNNRRVPMAGQTYFGTPLHDLWEDGREVHRDGGYMTEMFGEKAVEAVKRVDTDERPFFLYLPFTAPHYPMHAPERYKEPYRHLPWEQMIIAAMIAAMDEAIGKVLDELEVRGISDDTIVIFMSDNGPSREIRNWMDGSQIPYQGSSSGGLKGHKFSLFEGGIRVPGMLRWPAKVPTAQVVREPIAAMDFFPTILRAAGGEPDVYELDGTDVLAVLTDGQRISRTHLFWEQGEQTAVRSGPWKLVLNGQLEESQPPQDEVFLSHLDTDPGETRNEAEHHPEIVQELRVAAESWRAGIEERWQRQWLPDIPDYETHVFPAGVSK